MPLKIGKIVFSLVPRPSPLDPTPMTKIRFDNGCTVTIRDGIVQAPTPTLTAILDMLASRLPGYASIPFVLDEDFNIARGLIEKIGGGKIVRRDLDADNAPSRRHSEEQAAYLGGDIGHL